MFVLKDIIYNFFGLQNKIDDINKDQYDKGFEQRFNELLAGDFDDNELSLINNMVENLVDPFTLFEQYLIYEEYKIGLDYPIVNSNYLRRKIIPLMYHLYDIKSTPNGYDQFFRILGFDSITITEGTIGNGFDNENLTFDSDSRTFDSSGVVQGFYTVELTGTLTLTSTLIQLIYNVIKLNEPIFGELISITYNGGDIELPAGEQGSFNNSFNSSFDK